MQKLARFVFHPVIFAIYAPLFLLLQNLDEVKLYTGVRPVLVSALAAAVLVLLLRLMFRNWQRAGIVATLLLFFFFSYGHMRTTLGHVALFGIPITGQRYMLVWWLALLAGLLFLVIWKLKDTSTLTQVLNLVSVVLLVLLLLPLGTAQVQKLLKPKVSVQAAQTTKAQPKVIDIEQKSAELGISTVTKDLNPPPLDQRPDIYYIILDGYSRADMLQKEYNFDDQAFLDALKSRGFYVPQCTTSNYPRTVFSLASSLNMQYFVPLAADRIARGDNWRSFGDYMRGSVVRYTLQELGYKTVAYNPAHAWATILDTDLFITLHRTPRFEDYFLSGVSEFENLLINTTMIDPVKRGVGYFFGDKTAANAPTATELDPEDAGGGLQWIGSLSEEHFFYDYIQYNLQHLGNVPDLGAPKFVFAHILSTHAPFVFGADGSFRPGQLDRGYVPSIRYTNDEVLKAIDQIMATSKVKPVIIIQADHGKPTSRDRFAILNAYYLPNGGEADLYPTITPVNSFRVIFNRYFGGHLELLPDTSYNIQEGGGTYRITPVENSCKP